MSSSDAQYAAAMGISVEDARLALNNFAKAYGQAPIYTSPTYTKVPCRAGLDDLHLALAQGKGLLDALTLTGAARSEAKTLLFHCHYGWPLCPWEGGRLDDRMR